MTLRSFFTILLTSVYCCLVSAQEIKPELLIWQNSKDIQLIDSTGKVSNTFTLFSEIYNSDKKPTQSKHFLNPDMVRVYFSYERTKNFENEDDLKLDEFQYSLVILNIFQLHCRKLRSDYYTIELNKGNSQKKFEQLFDTEYTAVIEEFNKFRLETHYGTKKDIVNNWLMSINTRIEKFDMAETNKK